MPKPRFPEVDAEWTSHMRQSYERLLEQDRARTQTAPPERQAYAWDAVGNDCRELAYVLYASGESLDRVRALLADSAQAHLELVKRRATGDGGPSSPRPQEYATGHSCSTYLAICMAETSGEGDLARALAPFVWDPPGASYVAPNSVICTTDQQTIAYTLKHVVLNRDADAQEQLRRLTRVPEDVIGDKLMIRGIIERDRGRVLDGHSRVLAWHERVAAEKANYRVAKYYLSLPALGLSAVALQRGVVALNDLPADNPHFPRDLILRS
jgi:hypothetical protein